MTTWRTWVLGAWIGLVLSVAAAGAVDASADRSPGRTGVLPDRSGGFVAASASVIPVPIEEPGTPRAVAEFVGRVAMPNGVEASSVGIDAALVPVGKTDDGALAVPDFGTAGWYELGVRPGETGSAVLAGHVDSTDGPDVFYALGDLEPGDEVVVRRSDGTAATFRVEGRELVDKDALPVERIFNETTDARLTLITCGGSFDRSRRSYDSNVIVYARLVSDSG